MKLTVLILCAIPALVASISVSPNGNSPEIKMVGGMMVDVQKGFIPISPRLDETVTKTNEVNKKSKGNSTKLPINERYRRLIPYMTFYYANDMSTPTTESHISSTKSVEIEKAEIVEAKIHEHQNPRQPKKIVYSVYRDIPRYVGNRLTQFNKASAIPIKHYNEGPSQQNIKFTPNYNPLSDYIIPSYDRFVPKQIYKTTSSPYTVPTRKPYLNFYDDENTANIKYYQTEDQLTPKYKLVPYEQTPPVTIRPQIYNDNVQKPRKPIPVPVMIPKDHVYISARPAMRPQYYYYDTGKIEQPLVRKPPKTVSDNFYGKQNHHNIELTEPTVESGFQPIPDPSLLVTGSPVYRTPEVSHHSYETRKPAVQVIETQAVSPEVDDYVSNYNQYIEPTYNTPRYSISNSLTLKELLNSLQLTKSIPKTITQENVGSSIRTLLQVLNTLKGVPQINDEAPLLSSPKPFVSQKVVVESTEKPVTAHTQLPPPVYKDTTELHQEPYLAPVEQPSQHLDDIPGGTSQQFPLPVNSDEEGGTPGQPGVDYPILTTIPHTSFDCKTQRYKGFFADPETRCQVWHYCDLNGGQASFLCPNGTIFSQAGLTCDWWFNVRCASAAQLYVLNESLYKYILPHSPKFPEDYSGPLVDKYLTLKFKEMEEQFKKNKGKMSESQEDSEEESTESTDNESSTVSTEVMASTSEATSNDERQE